MSSCPQDGALDRDMDFWVCVCCQFAVGEQLATLVSILHFLLQLPDDKDDGETVRLAHLRWIGCQ